jgi:hypothetical protein
MGAITSRIVGLLVLAGIVLGLVRGLGTQRPPKDGATLNTGFTFSERQAGYLDVSWQQAFHAAMDLQPDVVRLGAYWDTIEPKPGQYDFTTIDWLLDNTAPQSSVLLTVGMKAPRWPEYYLPGWLRRQVQAPQGSDVAESATVRAAALQYVKAVVQHEKGRTNIKYWQVENEPLDPSGPRQWTIDAGFLSEEVALVRSLDPTRPVVLNMFVDTSPLGYWPPARKAMIDRAQRLVNLADVVGLDVYPVRPMSSAGVNLSLTWPAWEWQGRLRTLQAMGSKAGKPVWISEAQAEPWVPAKLVASAGGNTSPGLTTSTVDSLQAAGFNTILLWGVEYWYQQSQQDDGSWWSHMMRFFNQATPMEGTPPSA